ncbi:MAG: bifunctional serine/threonine-protein kinase/formylglycine-generating enzyme family protein [Planctomycetota bacterium]
MTDERWLRIRDLVERALDREPADRDAFLDEACAGDAELRQEAEELLALESRAGSRFLEPLGAGEPGELESGKHVLGGFEILRELGRGAMGVVYLARQPSLNRAVALKVFVAGLGTTEREIERFHREARAASRLRHPGIVQVLVDGTSGNTHWFAMEHVEGHDLDRELELQRAGSTDAFLPAPGERDHASSVAQMCADIADALHYAHGQGLVHRDVKPSNLLLDADGRVQVADFGIVRDEAEGSLTRTGELAGTPYYMSPEQARLRDAAIDHRTDVYSLGVVLYELATHRRPFTARSSADLFTKIRDVQPRAPRAHNPRVPRDLETICLTAMAKDPGERYASAGEMAEDLRRFVAREPIVARPPSLAVRALRWGMRRRYWVAGAVLLVGGIVVGSSATRRATKAAGQAEVTVLFSEGSLSSGQVSVSPVDPVSGEVGQAVGYGNFPVGARSFQLRLEAGLVRIVVNLAGDDPCTFSRDLRPGEEVVVEPSPSPERRRGMIWIPGGTLSIREPDAAKLAINFRDVAVAGFWLDETEVTNEQYRAFLDDTGHAPPRHWDSIATGRHDELPVVQVGWLDARAYAEWAGKRLPSFPEWTWAARGVEERTYPWPGAVPGEYRGNTLQPLVPDFSKTPDYYLDNVEPVRSHPDAATESGLYHMFGNVREWTESFLGEPVGNGFEPRRDLRLMAGHAWHAAEKQHELWTFAFAGVESDYGDYLTGFRCAL